MIFMINNWTEDILTSTIDQYYERENSVKYTVVL